jgi:hypothetical protein
MASKKYPLPEFLVGRCTAAAYYKWLNRRTLAHVKRDRKRGHAAATREAYISAIHAAVERSEGLDSYTGETLAWELISTYDNTASQEGGRKYKKSFWNLPSVDHVGDDLTAADFRICSWRTIDCKNDLSHEELVEFCEIVLAHAKRKARSATA